MPRSTRTRAGVADPIAILLAGIATLAASGAVGHQVDRELTSRTRPAAAPPRPRRRAAFAGLPLELAGVEPATAWVRLFGQFRPFRLGSGQRSESWPDLPSNRAYVCATWRGLHESGQ